MAMSDCADCWETPCTCGSDYKGLSDARRLEIARAALPKGGPSSGCRAVLTCRLSALLSGSRSFPWKPSGSTQTTTTPASL